ncbi:hypothetical protein INT44_004587, partial [Umbelopsis vinacea]
MLNLAYFKRKSAAINDENAVEVVEDSYAPAIPYLSYPQKEPCQTITDTRFPNELDWVHYNAKIEALPRTPNRFNTNPQFWNNHQALRHREMFDPLALRTKIQMSGDPFLSLFSTHERYRYRILNDEGEPCPPFSCEYNHVKRDGKLLAVADEAGKISILETDKDAYIEHETARTQFYAHGNAVIDVKWSKDDEHLLTASGDRTARLWDAETHECISVMAGHDLTLKCANFHPTNKNLIVTGSKDGAIKLWDTRVCGARTADSEMTHSAIKTIQYAHDENRTKKRRRTLPTKSKPQPLERSVTAAFYLPYKDNIIASSGSYDGQIKFWDCRAGRDAQCVESSEYDGDSARPRGILNMIMDNAGTRLFTLCTDHHIYERNITDIRFSQQRYTNSDFLTGSGFYVQMSISPDDRYLLTGSREKTAFVWQVGRPQECHQFTGHEAEVSAVDWSKRDIGQLATCSDDFTVAIWNLDYSDD